MTAWREAKRAGQSARNRALADRRAGDDPDGRLDRYLEQLAASLKRDHYSLDTGRCVLCPRRTRLRVGTLPRCGAVLFCPDCEPAYRLLRGEANDASRKIHLAAEDGTSKCGLGSQVTRDPVRVTCLRCQLYTKQTPVISRIIGWFR